MGFVEYIYTASAILFVLSLKWMSEVKTSRQGNLAGAVGMFLAVVATLLAVHLERYDTVAIAAIAGIIIGVPMALKMPMTAVPQRTAISHAFGALAAALVGTAKFYQLTPNIDTFTMSIICAEVILGFLTVTGSVIAFGKLQDLISGRPFVFKGRNVLNLSLLAAAVVLSVLLIIDPSRTFLFPIIAVLALVFGFQLVMGIGGADMPTVIAILNAYAGLSAAALGFVLNNKLLIVAGALDGSSGLILAILMCKAMNRSFANVLFGGFGATVQTSAAAQGTKTHKSVDVEEAAQILLCAGSVVIVPGFGMAADQAQHAVRDLASQLESKGINVKFAIHPVAGRMPGHMNVLLAEADVPYTQLIEMEEINSHFDQTDVSLVIGANDVVNPAARHDKASPIYGMPILDVDKSQRVIVIKRSMNPGFAGIDNELFYLDQSLMLFGSAKKVVTELVQALKE
ncbi:MAG: NAD(P)(+) transhydrogenase (Re/Si-specific) subunit beta [Deltaproteobacteria bacterium]|nr:NAD(P)(+) transhydrogenase (Re/Si-specific) subunit beta [Deltaproteobacteria bacterium]